METVDSMKNRLHNAKRTVAFLKEMGAPQELIDKTEQSVQILTDQIQRQTQNEPPDSGGH